MRRTRKALDPFFHQTTAASEGVGASTTSRSETDLSRYDLTRGARGKYLEKARRSFETIIVDKRVADTLDGPEAVTAVLEALAKSVTQAKKKRRAAWLP
jgi:hypothetical protein